MKKYAKVGDTIRILKDKASGSDVHAGDTFKVAKLIQPKGAIETEPVFLNAGWGFFVDDYEVVEDDI